MPSTRGVYRSRRFKLLCHKDLTNSSYILGYIDNYEKLSGTRIFKHDFLQFKNKEVMLSLEALGLSTDLFRRTFNRESFMKKPQGKFPWEKLIPYIQKNKNISEEEAYHYLKIIFSKIIVENPKYQKELFFVFYNKKDENYTSIDDFSYITDEEDRYFLFSIREGEDGYRPKVHLEKLNIENPKSMDNKYYKVVKNTDLVVSGEQLEELEENFRMRLALSESENEIDFILETAKILGIDVR